MQEYEIFFYSASTYQDQKEYWEFESEQDMIEYVKSVLLEDENITHAEVNEINYIGVFENINGKICMK